MFKFLIHTTLSKFLSFLLLFGGIACTEKEDNAQSLDNPAIERGIKVRVTEIDTTANDHLILEPVADAEVGLFVDTLDLKRDDDALTRADVDSTGFVKFKSLEREVYYLRIEAPGKLVQTREVKTAPKQVKNIDVKYPRSQ